MAKPNTNKLKIIAIAAAVLIFIAVASAMKIHEKPRVNFDDTVTKKGFARSSDFFFEYEITRYPSMAEVVNMREDKALIGFDVDSEKINFGVIPTNGSYAKKGVNMTNIISRDARIFIQTRGSIAPHISIEKDGFVLEKGAIGEVGLTFSTGSDGKFLPVGNYTGEVDVIVQIPRFMFIYDVWNK